jgi:hypothetical protein
MDTFLGPDVTCSASHSVNGLVAFLIPPGVFAIKVGVSFVEEQVRLEAESSVELFGGTVGIR